MEVVISKVEELKVLIDSATERVKGSSVLCLQGLLHHLVAFYSTERFVFVSLVVVDRKTGKEQRFYSFRDLLNHSKSLLNQTGQNKNANSNQYLERVLGNRGGGDNQATESSRNVTETSPQNTPQSHPSHASHGNNQIQDRAVRHATHSYTPSRTQISQPQCPQSRMSFMDVGAASIPLDHPARPPLARQAHQGPPISATHILRNEDPASLQKDNSDYITHRLLSGPENVPVSVSTSQNYANFHYNTDTISLVPHPGQNETGRNPHSNRDHQLLIQTNEQPYSINQPRCTVTQYIIDSHNASHQLHYSMSNMQAQGSNGHNISNSYSERGDNVVMSRPPEPVSFSVYDTSNARRDVQSQNTVVNLERRGYADVVSRTIPQFSAPIERTLDTNTIHVSHSSHTSSQNFQESPVSVRSLESLADDDPAPPLEPCDWSSRQRREQVQRKKIDTLTTPSQSFTETRRPFATMASHYNNSNNNNKSIEIETLDLTGSSKGSSDMVIVSEVDARRALSRMTNTPMITPRPILQNIRNDRTLDSPHPTLQPVCWSSCTKEMPTLEGNLLEDQPVNFVSQESISHRFNGSQIDKDQAQKDQALNALLAKKLTEGTNPPIRPAPPSTAKSTASSGHDFDSGSETSCPQQDADKNNRKTRNAKRVKPSGFISRRKSSSPQKIAVNESSRKGKAPTETRVDSSDDEADLENYSEMIVWSDSANDEATDKESSGDFAEIPRKKNCMRYYCFYCKEVNCKVTLKDLLHHMSFHQKTTGDKTGLPCLQCGKLFKHKAQGIDGMYSTMLACLNHMMCQHSCEVPDYMRVHKCSQCSFVSLIKNVVKRHEQCHVTPEPDSQSHVTRKTTQKGQQSDTQTNPTTVNDCLFIESISKDSVSRESAASNESVSKVSSSKESSSKESASKDNSASKDKEHCCSNCKKKYSSKSALAIHVERKHKNINSFLCSKCPSSFYAKVDLERHMYAQHSVNISKRAVIKCTICDYQSLEGSLMRKHIKNHQTGSFICDICSKEFGTQNRLKSHRMIHTAERKYKCDHCDYATAKRYHYERHVAVRHKGQFWKCSSCSMLSFNQNNLQKHINKAHQGNAEIKEVDNLKDSSGEKKQKTNKKKTNVSNVSNNDQGAKRSNVNVASNGCHDNPTGSTVQLLTNSVDVDKDGGLTAMTNFQEPVQSNSETTLDSAMEMVLDPQSQGLLTVKSQTLLWQLQ